jgi:hypothetical protein
MPLDGPPGKYVQTFPIPLCLGEVGGVRLSLAHTIQSERPGNFHRFADPELEKKFTISFTDASRRKRLQKKDFRHVTGKKS